MYLGDVYRFVLRIVRHAQTAEDVTQDAFANAYVALPRFRWRAKFSTWLFGIAHNCAVDAIRRSARQQRLLASSVTERTASDPGVRLMLHAAIDALPDDLRRAFTLVEVFGFNYAEASAILDWPIGTLKSRMHRARRLLMDALSDEEDAGEM
jgi:RNA polymerase sigma-70 factor, ECF subfamily